MSAEALRQISAAAKIESESEGVIDIEARARIIQRKRAVWDKLINKSKI